MYSYNYKFFIEKMSIFQVKFFLNTIPKKLLSLIIIINSIISFGFFSLAKAERFEEINTENINLDYLNSRNELEDYMIDTGDVLLIEFFPANELNSFFTVNEEGEIFLPRLNATYVRGLTIVELKDLLQKKFLDYLINPEIDIRIAKFKSIRILISGEVRNPGIYKFPSYTSNDINDNNELDENISLLNGKENQNSNSNITVKRSSDNLTTISDAIAKAGGITSSSDLSQIEVIREVPLSKGGGYKKAKIDFRRFLNNFDSANDIRLFDGDRINIPISNKKDSSIIPKSILSGISPKFIKVNIFGRVENPGMVMLPLESSLSDVIDLAGPIRPLSGRISIIRYNKDGSILKKLVNYASSSRKGSSRNPFIKDGDIISVRNSLLGKSTGVIGEITKPFIGIYTTKELIEDF